MIVTRNPELHRRIEALHNAGYAKDRVPPENWYGDTPLGWGHGRRMSELQGAIARVQLRKLDSILECMRGSHARLEDCVRSLGMKPRARADVENPGDTGYYCIFQLPVEGLEEEQKIARGRSFAAALAPWGLHPWFLHDFEVHVYYNIQPLVEKWPMNGGCPWACEKNAFHVGHAYDRGALPRLDAALISHAGINVPSRLTVDQEGQIMEILRRVFNEHFS